MVTNGYSDRVRVSAGTAFKAGFFAFFGAVIASLILSIFVGLGLAVVAAMGIAHFNSIS